MRITTVLIGIQMFFTGLLTAGSLNAQSISLKVKKATIKQVFISIEQQAGITFVFDEQVLKGLANVSLRVTDAPLSKVLETLSERLPLQFRQAGKLIGASRKPSKVKPLDEVGFDPVLPVRAQSVTGTVLDEKGQPLRGATVQIKGTKTITTTKEDGSFNLNSSEDSGVLLISFLGYATEQIKFDRGNAGLLTIVLKMVASGLKEIEVNAGYYTVKDKERTGSISRITAAQIERQPVNNVLQAMQANIPGAEIVQNTGMPGGGFTVQIRGRNSIQQGIQPFYIIDGVPFMANSIGGSRDNAFSTMGASPLASINPNDIESIEVLKDADATAIYGSRGSNGVILITTKRGKPGKARTSISINQGIARVAGKLDLMNTDEYLAVRSEALSNDKLPVSSTDYDLNGTWDKSRYTDWQKELIGGTAPTTTIQASLSGGTENITYLIGGNFYKEKTVFPGESTYGRNSGNFNLGYVSDNKKFRASSDVNYSQVNSNLIINDLTRFITLIPNYPSLTNEGGQLNWGYDANGMSTMYENPIAYTQRPYDVKVTNLISNATLSYTPIPGLRVKGNFGYTMMNRNEFASEPLSTYSPALGYGADRRRAYFTNNETGSWIFEAQADWSKRLGSGQLNVLIGTTFQQGLTQQQGIRGSGYTNDALMETLAAASTFTIEASSYSSYKYNATYGRINYVFKDQYILNATGRRDGSSRFGNDNRFANFGALGLGWIISEYGFVKRHLPFISFAKFRASYGISGNDQIADYGYLDTWNPRTTYQDVTTIAPLRIKNPSYAWEVTRKGEAAFDVGALYDRITLNVGYYSNSSSNQLLPRQLPPSTGFSSITGNLPAKVGNTGWEFDLNTKNINGAFKWSTLVNLTIPKNKLIDYPGLATSADATRFAIGQPLNIKKLYSTSVDPQTGLYKVEDYDKNGVIDAKDRYINVLNGRRFYGGFQNSIFYKNFQLDVLFQFVKQTGSGEFSGSNMPGYFVAAGPTNNQLNIISNHWTTLGATTDYQKYTTLSTAYTSYSNATLNGSYATTDASFIKLKNLAFSYNLSASVIQRLKLRQAKAFLQGQNLLTITRYKGLDPETQTQVNLPQLQALTAGVQITF